MANLKEVRDRIKSVQNTQQITKAMKLVSASKLRRAQEAIQRMRPYTNRQNAMLRNILSNVDMSDVDIRYGEERPVHRACMVVITSNRGLAGAFNTNVIKAAVATINERYAEQLRNGNLTILPIGKKGRDFFKKRYPEATLNEEFTLLFDDLTFDNVSRTAEHLMESFVNGTYDEVYVAYAQFRNAAVQTSMSVQFLPVEKIETADEEAKPTTGYRADYIFEPNASELLQHLVPSILKATFYSYNLDTHASEHGARMTAMDKATENANELLRDLKISYNKARQEAITNEILEIVGGAAALEAG